MKNSGSMAESVDAADLKSASENCAGSSPATPTTMLQKCLDLLNGLNAVREPKPNKISASYRVSDAELAKLKLHEIESYIKEKIAHTLAYVVVSCLADFEHIVEHSTHTHVYSASVNVFTDEELRKHDQDIIEEFCSREK